MHSVFRIRDWTVGRRLALSFGLILTLSLMVSIMGIGGIQEARSLHETFEQALDLQARSDQLQSRLALDVVRSQAIIRSVGMPEVAEPFKPALLKNDQHIDDDLDWLQGQAQTDVRTAAQALSQAHAQYRRVREQVLNQVEMGQTIEAQASESSQLIPASLRVTQARDHLTLTIAGNTRRAQDEFMHKTSTARVMIMLFTGMTLIGGVALSTYIARSISAHAHRVVRVSEAIASGRLSEDIPTSRSHDELGRMTSSMRKMRDSLIALTTEVRTQSTRVAHTSQSVAGGAQSVMQRSSQHARDLSQSSQILQSIESDLMEGLRQTQQASEMSAAARDVAHDGKQAMSDVIDTMQGIQDASRRVADIISVIDGIAFQTNILALNAAVEAARAGDQGRGFAVVASEVRSLAQRSAVAAKEIKQLIADSVARVAHGTEQVNRTEQTIESLRETITQVAHLMQSLSETSRRHAQVISEVKQTVQCLDQTTQSNMHLMQASTQSATELQAQASALMQAISVFETPALLA